MTNSRNEANFSQISNLISSYTWQSTWIYNESSDCCAVFSGYNRGNRGNHFYIISCLSFQMIIYILNKRKLYSYTCTMFNLCKFELKYQNHKLAVNEINILDIITVFLSFVWSCRLRPPAWQTLNVVLGSAASAMRGHW